MYGFDLFFLSSCSEFQTILCILFLFQIPMKQHKDCNFSYAGLKTQVKLAIASRNVYVDQTRQIPIMV